MSAMDGYNGQFADMTLARGARLATDDDTKAILSRLLNRINSIRAEHEVFRTWCDRADALYFPPDMLPGGADLWADHISAKVNGRQHVSVNTFGTYVDVPAALQAVEPIEDILATDNTPEARTAAAAVERIYTAWKQDEDFELKFHKATTVKGLYGRTAARVYWDKDLGKPCVEVVQQPRNLFMGWKTDEFEALEWAAYRMYYDPQSLTEEYGVEVKESHDPIDGVAIPLVMQKSWDDTPNRITAAMMGSRIEVYDYWYREPVWSASNKFLRMKTMNVVVAGNLILREPREYREYKGKLPYIPVFNTFVPGMPSGIPDLYLIESLLREKMEAITRGSQMIANVTSGDAYQLIGPDSPSRVPAGLKPVIGQIIAPGPGNRVEVITPFIAQFQLEQYLTRIDRELATESGLNDLLLGLAPAQVLSSSKAINALIANYESRLSIRRKLLYKFRRNVWEMALAVYAEKNKDVAGVVKRGGGFLLITDPSLSPRDDMETATRALNLMNGKLWSQRTAMNVVGVDDPETEQDLIREERTDATMFPADVQVMAQLMQVLQALGLQPPAGAAQQAGAQATNNQNDLRTALGGATPDNSTSSQLAGDQGVTPPIPGAPQEAGGGADAPLASAPSNAPVMQGMLQNGQAKGRVMTQTKLGRG